MLSMFFRQSLKGASLAPSAASNSPGVITYSVVSGPATINGNVISLPTAGTVVIQAKPGGD